MTRTMDSVDDVVAVMGIDFSPEQIAAITAPMSPGVIVAGAGTGKTTVMAARVVWLVGRGEVAPERVLGLTFTRKAAGELSGRLRAALRQLDSEQESYPQVLTYDAFAARVVSEFGAWVGIGGVPRVLGAAESFLLADEAIRSAADPPVHLADKGLSSLTEDVVALESQIQAHLVPDDAIVDDAQAFLAALDQAPRYRGSVYKAVASAAQTVEQRLDLLELCRRYRELKKRHSVVDFADQMAIAVDLAQRLPMLGERARVRYGLVVVDEFQDTSPAQARLLSCLFGTAGGIRGYPVTAVGDPLQAIYTWRGAAVDGIYAFDRLFGPAGAAYPLTINRRSGPQIIALANAISTEARADPLLGGRMTVELAARTDAPPADVVVQEFPTWVDEAEWIADEIAAAHRWDETGGWDRTAILLRRNRDIGPIVQACRDRGVPVAVQGLSGLLSIEAVSQLCAMMKLVTDGTANPEVIEILTGPRFRLGVADLGTLGARALELARLAAGTDAPDTALPPIRLIDAVGHPGEARFSVHARDCFARLWSDLGVLKAHQGGLVDHVRRIVARIGLDVEVHASQQESAPEARQFLGYVAEFAVSRPEARLDALVAYVDAEREFAAGLSRADAMTADAVPIMTIHQAKGLEWDTVYLPCVAAGVFPQARLTGNPLTSPAALPTAIRSDAAAVPQIHAVTNQGLGAYAEELRLALSRGEDRLAYVGVTRARTRLVITSHQWGLDLATRRGRSRYLEQAAQLGQEWGNVCLLADDQARPDPVAARVDAVGWPQPDDPRWQIGAAAVRAAAAGHRVWDDSGLPPEASAEVAAWDDLIAALSRETARTAVVDVPLPSPLNATQLTRLARDDQAFAAQLVRPLPHPPSHRASVGAQFHTWVEQHFSSSTLPYAFADAEDAVVRLRERFLASRFASARPLAVEQDFATTLAGQVVSGRIDAVFRAEDNPGLVPGGKSVLIVDWKTGSAAADPRQLAVYAQAWATLTGQPLDQIAAGFFYVLEGRFVPVEVAEGGIHWAHEHLGNDKSA